jgi:hypothetical protein
VREKGADKRINLNNIKIVHLSQDPSLIRLSDTFSLMEKGI